MNRILSIFDLFRHGHAERELLRRDPFLLIHTFAPGLIEDSGQELVPAHRPAVCARWTRESEECFARIRMNWIVNPEGGRLP